MDSPLKRHNYTLYYSSFSIFEDSANRHLLKCVFREKLLKRLRDEWSVYAGQILFQENHGQHHFLNHNTVFEAAFTIWVASHEEKHLKSLEQVDSHYDFEMFEAEFSQKFRIFNKNEALFKPVLQSFFATAQQTWTILPENPSISKKLLKTHKKEVHRSAFLKRKTHNMSSIRPLLLVSQTSKENIDIKEALLNLNLNDESHRTFDVYMKKVSKLEEQVLTRLDFSRYLKTFVDHSKEKWQVARCFVTNMFEVNYNRILELENRVSSTMNDFKNNVRFRVLQPAESFYQHLMKIWLTINDINSSSSSLTSNIEVSFEEYLQKVKETMGPIWSEKYIAATEMFFQTLITEWRSLNLESDREEKNLASLIKRVREDLLQRWEQHIIGGIEDM